MKKILTTGFLLLSLAIAGGCGDDGGAGDDDGGDDDTTPMPDADTTPPPAPALGAQIERMGRPAINTALNHTFDGDATATQAAKDAYNENDDPSTWVAAFAEEMEANLGILDSLDANCGNQFGAAATLNDERYNTLAGALADDKLYVKSDSGTCTQYLAVEGAALGIPNTDCGGRVPSYDVIETTYSAVAAGALAGVDDNIDAEDVATSATAFPFLGDPS
jgi:hypothetical protein